MKEHAPIIATVLIVIGIFAGVAVFGSPGSQDGQDQKEKSSDTSALTLAARDTCVDHGSQISYHIHPRITIHANGEPQTIPSNIGVDSTCMKSLHTHDASGVVHVEYPEEHTFTLGDFFANWGEEFSKDQLLAFTANETHEVRLYVNGEESDAYENLILEDNQQIEIFYEEIEE